MMFRTKAPYGAFCIWGADGRPAGTHSTRVERQTFFPVPCNREKAPKQVTFTIHVARQPLPDAVQTHENAQQLHEALASMRPAVLKNYKGFAAARDGVLAWLAARAGSDAL